MRQSLPAGGSKRIVIAPLSKPFAQTSAAGMLMCACDSSSDRYVPSVRFPEMRYFTTSGDAGDSTRQTAGAGWDTDWDSPAPFVTTRSDTFRAKSCGPYRPGDDTLM